MSDRLELRPAFNVTDALQRDALVRRALKIRAEALQQKHDIEYWNKAHPNETPIDTGFEDAVIAWCDGKGPMPSAPVEP